MSEVQISVSDQQTTQISLAAPDEAQIVAAIAGVQGATGPGVASGGTTNDVLFKLSSNDYDTAWGQITSAMIGDLEIVNADIASGAAIELTKLANGALPGGITVSGINLLASIDDLSDVDTSSVAPASGEALVWNGSEWTPGPAGAEAAGNAIGQIQYNDGGSPAGLAASSGFVWDDTNKELDIQGDINLDDGGSFTTTLQTITATANRTISFPDATGTIGLVAGSSGQIICNGAGAYSGVTTLTTDGSGNLTLTGRLTNSFNSASLAPAKQWTGTWITGQSATNNKPHVLIEGSGATSTAWSTAGTGLGINSASAFNGRLVDLQANGTSRWHVSASGLVVARQPTPAEVNTSATLTIANLHAGIITTTTASGVNMTLPTGTAMDAGIAGVTNDMAFMWSVINTGPNSATIVTASGHSLVGASGITTATSGRFTSRRTAANTWVSYRIV